MAVVDVLEKVLDVKQRIVPVAIAVEINLLVF